LKIHSFETFYLRIPLKKKYSLSRVIGSKSETDIVIVKIHTDTDIVGYGEADPHVPFTEESAESVCSAIARYLAPVLIGRDPLDIDDINSSMDKAMKLNLMAKGSIDMACHDIVGKYFEKPIHRIFEGMDRHKIPLIWAVGNSLPAETVEDVDKAYQHGFGTIMIKTGLFDTAIDLERLEMIRKLFPDLKLIVDVNQGWDVDTAIMMGRKLEKLDIQFIEQPVPYWDIKGLSRIRNNISIPLSVDESLLTVHDAKMIISEKADDIFSVKVSKNGGLTKTKELVSLAGENGLKCWMNSMLEEGVTQAASLNLGLVTPNLLDIGHAYFSPLRLVEDITTYSDLIKETCVYSPQNPGLGIEVKEESFIPYMKEHSIFP